MPLSLNPRIIPAGNKQKGLPGRIPCAKSMRNQPNGLLLGYWKAKCPPKTASTRGSPLPQGDSSQLDQVPHAGRDEDGGFITVPGFIVAFHLLHHELGMSQERVLCEAVEVQPRGRYSGLQGGVG